MMYSSPLPRGRQPRYHEASGLRSTRDQDATARQWIRARTTGQNNGGTDRQLFFLLQKLNRQRRRVPGGGATSSSGGMNFKGEYNNGAYKSSDVVIFTPDGQSPGTYVALQDVPAGQSPDVGFPYWVALPTSPSGVWA